MPSAIYDITCTTFFPLQNSQIFLVAHNTFCAGPCGLSWVGLVEHIPLGLYFATDGMKSKSLLHSDRQISTNFPDSEQIEMALTLDLKFDIKRALRCP